VSSPNLAGSHIPRSKTYLHRSVFDSSRIDFASRLARRATTEANGDGAGTSSSLLMRALLHNPLALRKRRSRSLFAFSLPFPPLFRCLFRPPPLPFYSLFHFMFGHHPTTVRLAERKRHGRKRFECSEALAELPAVARTSRGAAWMLRQGVACRGAPQPTYCGVGPGRVAHRRHQERVERALFGPAHHVGARRSSITARLGHGVAGRHGGPACSCRKVARARRRSELGNRLHGPRESVLVLRWFCADTPRS
jgi:hypothetical protein